MRLLFDIETNGLIDTTTKIHSLVIQDADTGKVYSCTDNDKSYISIAEGISMLEKADEIIGHNIICFDIPCIKRLLRFIPQGKITDTLVMSRLIYPDMYDRDWTRSRSTKRGAEMPVKLYGRHSLEAWGYRLSERKGDFTHETDWKEWSPEMQSYCEQDVKVTACLYEHFQQMHYSAQSLELEHEFQKIIQQQETNGFPFDYDKASQLYIEISAEREQIRQELQKVFPPKDNGCMFTPKVNNKAKGYVKGIPIWKPKIEEFNPGSRQEIVERLKEKYNWQPKDFSNTGLAKIDDTILETLPYPEAKLLARYFLLQKRLGQIGEGKQAWLKCAVKESDGIYRIHGRVTTNGAVTGRCTHHDPNIAQVPAVGVPYGEECRSLFYAPKGYSLLGCDASGLELRCLSHYMARYDGGAYAKVILEGDIHWHNAQALGLVPEGMARDKDNAQTEYARNKIAKRFIYAFLYGAGGEKIGEICAVGEEEKATLKASKAYSQLKQKLTSKGEDFTEDTIFNTLKGNSLKAKFLKAVPALALLNEDVQNVVKERGWLKGLDGRQLPVRSQHSALNTLLQSAGAIAVKKATCIFWELLRDNGLADKVKQVAHIHDEFQCLVEEGYEEQVGALAVQSFRQAGTYFHFRCPLDGEFKYGKNWAETH